MSTTTKKNAKSAKAAPAEPQQTASDFTRFFTDSRVRREYIEMVVFVLVLVCFLRLFGVEAYVIPSGSMATTLLGANKVGVCPECGYHSYVDARAQVENGEFLSDSLCQNCQHAIRFEKEKASWGDRILVDKLRYTRTEPEHWDVAVFKFPDGVQRGQGPIRSARTNYIKRLVGLPGETLGIDMGDLFFKTGDEEFSIAQKPPHVVMATRRLVFDNDYLPADLVKMGAPPRWFSQDGWDASEDGKSFTIKDAQEGWLVYRHARRPELVGADKPTPSLITDFEAYNTENFSRFRLIHMLGANWVGDLMLECDLTPQSNEGEIVLELVEAHRTFRCLLDLAKGEVALTDGEVELARTGLTLASGTSHRIRFANIDDRLILWVGGSLFFDDGVDVALPERERRGPTVADLRPVRIGARGAEATVAGLRIFRDIYYTKGITFEDPADPLQAHRDHQVTDGLTLDVALRTTPERIDQWRKGMLSVPRREFALGEDQFFFLGDNSPQSADARDWVRINVVERRLLLGKAIVRFWPIVRMEGGWPELKWKFVQ